MTMDEPGPEQSASTPLDARASLSPRRWRRGAVEAALVFLLFLAMTLGLMHSALGAVGTRLIGINSDGFQFAWNMWWFREALFVQHTTPFHTTLLYHPTGTTLLFHTLSPFNSLISIPFQGFLPLLTLYNVILIVSFAVSGVGMYYLARYLTGSRPAAVLSGIIYTFCPWHFGHMVGHLNLVSMQWPPVYVLFLLKTVDKGGRRNAVLAGVFLVLTMMCSLYQTVYAFLLTALVLVVRARKLWRDPGRLKATAIIFVVYFLAVGPVLGAMVHKKMTRDFLPGHPAEQFGADVATFFLPGLQSAYGGRTAALCKEHGWTRSEFGNYLGYTVLALAAVAAVRVRQARFWGACGLIFLLFALGPKLHVMGRAFDVPMPYTLLEKTVPFFSFSGVPTRMTMMTMFCLAVMSGYSAALWLSRPRKNQAIRWGVPAVLTVLILVEYLPAALPTTAYEAPAAFARMAWDPENYAVLELPWFHMAEFGTTVHHKPIVGGVVSRLETRDRRFLEETPVIRSLIWDLPLPDDPDLPRLARRIFAQHNIRYPVTRDDRFTERIEKQLKLSPIECTGSIRVYDCR